MKQFISFFICSTGFATLAISQPVWTDRSNRRIMEWDSMYTIETKAFRADSAYENVYQHVIRKNNKVVAEYFRHDDFSFLYVSYDSIGWINNRGLIKYTDGIFNCEKIEIPDLARDPDYKREIMKDSVFCNGSYRKNGIWKETDSLGMIWKGEYKNGLREGEWKEGYLYKADHSPFMPKMYDYFRPLITHHYKYGMENPLYNNNDLKELIKNTWYYYPNWYKPSSRLLYFKLYKNDANWKFLPNNTIEITEPVDKFRKRLTKNRYQFVTKDDKLIIHRNNKQWVLQLVYVLETDIILKVLDENLRIED